MNLKIKYRESFRPSAPSVLEEASSKYFELDTTSPYMLLVAPVRAEIRDRSAGVRRRRRRPARRRAPAAQRDSSRHARRLQRARADGQRDVHPVFHAVIAAFEALTGCAAVVNTSFNVRGEPIVCTPEDAYRCFMRTEMDLLVLGDCILEKPKQPRLDDDDSWRTEYELD